MLLHACMLAHVQLDLYLSVWQHIYVSEAREWVADCLRLIVVTGCMLT